MARSNFPGKTNNTTPKLKKSAYNPNLGVYLTVDEYGNIKQVKKEKRRTLQKYYPNEASTSIGDVFVIGVSDPISGSEGIEYSMGIGNNTEAYAVYI